MTALSGAWESFNRLPRAARWGAWGGAILALLLLYTDHVLRLTYEWNQRSEELLAELERASGGEGRLEKLDALRDVVRAVGPVLTPRNGSDAEKAFNDVVSGVLKKHTVTRDSFSYRGASKLAGGTLARAIAPGREVQKITGDLRFDATQEEAMAIISELEDSPEIEAISNLKINRQAKNKVTVDLTVEAWIIPAAPQPRAGGRA